MNLQAIAKKELEKYISNKDNYKNDLLNKVTNEFLTVKADTIADFTEFKKDDLFNELKDFFSSYIRTDGKPLIGKGNKYNADGVNSLRNALQSKLESHFQSAKYKTTINGNEINAFCKLRNEIIFIESGECLVHFVVNPKIIKVKDVLQNSSDTSNIDYETLVKMKKIIENNKSLKPEQVTVKK